MTGEQAQAVTGGFGTAEKGERGANRTGLISVAEQQARDMLAEQEAQEKLERALCADAGIPYSPRKSKMSERDLSREVRKMVDVRRLWGHQSYDYYRRSGPGWFDWVIIGPGGVLFRELKSAEGTVSKAQRYVQQMFARFGYDCAVWRPEDLADGTMARELDAIAAGPAGT